MGRAPAQASNSSASCTCCFNTKLHRGPWTSEEDHLLALHMKSRGDQGNWRKVPKAAGLARCGKSCRLRWLNYLRPDLKRGNFSEDEEDLIIKLHSLLGNRWSLIAGRIPGRSDNEIKNYWNFHLAKKLKMKGLNPRTHKPLARGTSSNDNNNNWNEQSIVKQNLELKPTKSLIDHTMETSTASCTTAMTGSSSSCGQDTISKSLCYSSSFSSNASFSSMLEEMETLTENEDLLQTIWDGSGKEVEIDFNINKQQFFDLNNTLLWSPDEELQDLKIWMVHQDLERQRFQAAEVS